MKYPLLAAVLIQGCTVINTAPLEPGISYVCIERNPDVIREDFLPAVIDGFYRHGLSVEIYTGQTPPGCDAVATYVAYQTWDMGMVMHSADVWIHQDHELIGHASFELKQGGGFSLLKWRGSEYKFGPAMDQMLFNY